MAAFEAIPHAHLSRRSFLTGVGAAAALGSAAVLGVADPAEAAGKGGGFGSGTKVFSNSSAPRPIEAVVGTAEPGFVPPPPFDFIHWLLPGPPGATTQILNLPAFGLDADPSLMTDYHGFTAYAVLAGSARGNNGEEYDVELDIRVMDGKYVGEDGRTHEGTFGFFWFDLFTPGQGAAGQVHDFNPGILPNGLFWTMEIPRNSFQKMGNGTRARLRVRDLPMPDTFFFSNNVSIAAQIDVDVEWKATSAPVRRGEGLDAEDPFFTKFIGEFAEASCAGRGGGRETGFQFKTGRLTADGFFAQIGSQRNGVFLE